jgi:hypothetical protein
MEGGMIRVQINGVRLVFFSRTGRFAELARRGPRIPTVFGPLPISRAGRFAELTKREPNIQAAFGPLSPYEHDDSRDL